MRSCIVPADILLPKPSIDLTKWAVIACDQFTSQSEYWREVTVVVADAPSTLNLIIPEAQLRDASRLSPVICENMALARREWLHKAVHGGVLVERMTSDGVRVGLVAAVDLEQYDYSVGSKSPIRATEGTILERLPPRVAIRESAPLELTHVMLLIDDPALSIIESLFARRDTLKPLYDVELMLGGGRLRGWAVEKEFAQVIAAFDALKVNDGISIAVGDGNHSLATAKKHFETIKLQQPESEWRNHPARFALVELCNLYAPGVAFHPIHRLLVGGRLPALLADFDAWCAANAINFSMDNLCTFISGETCALRGIAHALPVEVIQRFLDEYLPRHTEITVDYIHGESDLRELCAKDAVGILLPMFDKSRLFSYVAEHGALPRKAFSIGEAQDKRYYMEARGIT